MDCDTVSRYGRNHIFPDTIPKKRGNRNVKVKIIFSLITVAAGCYLSKNKWDYLVYVNAHNYVLLLTIEIINRICNLFEEINHLNSRYDKQLIILLKEIFSFNSVNTVAIIIGIAVTLSTPQGFLISVEGYKLCSYILSFIGVQIISEIIKLKENGIYTALLIEDLKGLDYGSGMAYSFFNGYLKLILPKNSNHQNSLTTNINVYQSRHHVEFATKKLYILIPLSAHCPNKLSDESDKIEEGAESEPIILDIAAVIARVYKNTVYKLLLSENKVVYVMAEYATPLKTLSKVMEQNSEEARRYKRYKKEIVTNFYMTLDKILRSDPECRDYCSLIYFRDIDEYEEHLNIDICDLLMKRIEHDLNNQ